MAKRKKFFVKKAEFYEVWERTTGRNTQRVCLVTCGGRAMARLIASLLEELLEDLLEPTPAEPSAPATDDHTSSYVSPFEICKFEADQ